MPEIAVCKVGDVASGSAIRVDKDGHRLAIVRIGDDWYAIGDRCSHAEASIAEGEGNIAEREGNIEDDQPAKDKEKDSEDAGRARGKGVPVHAHDMLQDKWACKRNGRVPSQRSNDPTSRSAFE